jgi:MFS transporter, PPP family, 3-phenylpropionic acid transporter
VSQAVPSARLGGLYGLYFALVALIVAWLGPYFQALGYTASEIGILIGILTGSKIVAPYLWGMLGDRIPNRLRVVQAGMLGSALVSGWLLATPGFWQLVVILAVLGLFWNAIIAQFDTLTLEYLGGAHHRYSAIRMWGSVGFICAMLASGAWFRVFSLESLPWMLLVGLLLSSLLTLWLPPVVHAPASDVPLGRVMDRLKSPVVWLFFVVAALNQFAHGPLNVFFTLYVQEHGYSALQAGQLWALAVAVEVVLFWSLPRFLARIDLRQLLIWALIAGAFRWVMTAFWVEQPWILMALQMLHALTFAAIHSVSIEFVRRWFPRQLAGRGMALYSGVVFGIGGSTGALASGFLWEHAGSTVSFVAMGVLSGLLAVVVQYSLKSARLGPAASLDATYG